MTRDRNNSVPSGWWLTTVGEVGHVKLGRQRSPQNRSNQHPTKYIRAANITWGGLDLSDVLDMDFKPTERETYRLRSGDVVLSEASGSQGEVGKPAIWRDEIENCCFQNTVIRFRPNGVEPDYAHLIFSHFARNNVFAQIAPGVGIHHLGADRFARIPFPVPPTAEQRRIVAKADELFSKLDAGVVSLKRVEENLKRYRASVLKAALEGKFTSAASSHAADDLIRDCRSTYGNRRVRRGVIVASANAPEFARHIRVPEGWALSSVGELLRDGLLIDVKDGNHGELHPKKDDFSPEGLPFVTASEVRDFRIDYTRAPRLTDAALSRLKIGFCEAQDVILTHKGTVGRVAVSSESCVLSPQTTYYRSRHDYLFPRYLQYFFASPQFQGQLAEVKSQTTRDYVPISKQYGLVVLVPPIDDQVAIARRLDALMAQCETTESSVAHSIRRSTGLRQAILKRAFEGRLAPQDPTDERAAVLFERIREQREAETNGMERKGKKARTKKGSRQTGKKKYTDEARHRQLQFTTDAKVKGTAK